MPAAVVSPSRENIDGRSVSRARPPRLEDFTLIRVLGRGNFGKVRVPPRHGTTTRHLPNEHTGRGRSSARTQVMLVEDNKTHKMFAIKVLKKEFIVENDEIERC